MTKDEVDCEDPENEDHPDCQCDGDDGDRQYDAWADERVCQFYERLEGRAKLYEQLLAEPVPKNIAYLEKMLIDNLTGSDWQLQPERKKLMQQLLDLWNDESTHTNKLKNRDRVEKKLVKNLITSRKWQDINSIHGDW